VYAVTSSWSGGFQAEVTVTAGTTAIRGWAVSWTFPAGQVISQVWNGTVRQSGADVTVTNAAYNGALAPGATASFGLIASVTGPNTAPAGLTCTTS
jgi:alpha-L-fucosidase 2